jgi:hypothetical protein
MARQSRRTSSRRRKTRTRQHVIADLSLHHVAGPVLRAGFTIEAQHHDYGIDAHIETFDTAGAAENGMIFLQLKATDTIDTYRLANGDFSFPMDMRDPDYWAREPYPAYLVLYDAQGDVAYWLYIQSYLQTQNIAAVGMLQTTLSLHIPRSQIVGVRTPAEWRQHKAEVISRIGSNLHD